MNTEHQNPKTQLPRVIEEKPIVYDDEQLEEVREVAALPPIQLSPDEIEYAISLFARGFARGDVVIGIIEQLSGMPKPAQMTHSEKDSPIDFGSATQPVPSLQKVGLKLFTTCTKNTSVRRQKSGPQRNPPSVSHPF